MKTEEILETLDRIKKVDVLKQAPKVLGLPYLKDKVICFISSWERTKMSLNTPAEEDEKEYIYQEMSVYENLLRAFRENAEFSFFAFREFADWDDIDFEEIENIKKKFPARKPKVKNLLETETKKDFIETASYDYGLSKFLSRHSVAYLKYQQKTKDLVGDHITVLPVNNTSREYIKFVKEDKGLPELHTINILCIDYSKFPYFILTHFLNYMKTAYQKEKPSVPLELIPLYKLFSQKSGDVSIFTYHYLKTYINDAYNNKLSVSSWDNIEFVAMNHIQNIQTPYFWQGTRKDGYLCQNNKENIIEEQPKGKEDFRFFYSLEALLVYELKTCLKRIRRCSNCGDIMSPNKTSYRGKHCPKGSPNYSKCNAERNRKRQQKHYNLTKT